MSMTPTEILSRLIAFDTTSHKSNLDLLDWIEGYLKDFDIPCERVYDQDGVKANLIASVGGRDRPGFVLSGHTDVVPVDGQDWSVDPFEGVVRDDRVWGRGASDMKGFIACVLAAVPEMVEKPLKRPLHFLFSHDEEVGCIGVRSALRVLEGWPVKPVGCFVGEPTSMRVIIGHKAKRSVRAVFRGRTGHSSLAPEAVNAAEYAARLAVFISDIGRRLRDKGPRDALYDVPHTTAHVGLLRGGTQLNIVPEHAFLDFEFRAVAEDDPNALVDEVIEFARTTLEPDMQAVDPGCGIDFEPISEIPGLATDAEAEIVTIAKHLSNRNSHYKVAFGTESGLISQIGIPTVVMGPGSIEQAHKADEFVDIDQLEACAVFLSALIGYCRS